MKNRFVDLIREALGKAGHNPRDYAGHSFSIGAAGACELNDSSIQMLSSTAYLVYIKTPMEQLASILAVSCR